MYERHIVIDLEFTPIPRRFAAEREIVGEEIIQIGAVMLDSDYRELDSFSIYVKPEFADHISPDVAQLTGISDADVESAAYLPGTLDTLSAWIGYEKKTRIYSWSSTDLYQLEDECWLKGVPFPENMYRWMDFQKVYCRLIGYGKPLSLKNAVSSVDCKFSGAEHTAMNDARATAELLRMTVNKEAFREKTGFVQELLSPARSCSTIGDILGSKLLSMAL